MIIEFEGFEDSIRNYICGVVSASFQRLSLENLKEFLGVSRSGLKKIHRNSPSNLNRINYGCVKVFDISTLALCFWSLKDI